jgi:amino acid transporter
MNEARDYPERGSSNCSEIGTRRNEKLLGIFGAVALVIANTIGTGVFTTSGFALADLGEPAFTFLRHTLHPALGTIAGWISLVAGFTTPIAAAALGAQLYLLRTINFELSMPWIPTGIILGLGFLHAGVPKKGVAFQNVAVLIKICAVLVFIGFGAPTATRTIAGERVPSAATFPMLAFAGSLVWISYAYSGWNAAVYVTGDIEGGGRTVKRALYSGTLLVIALYLGVSAVILYGAPPEEIRGVAESGAIAALAIGGPLAEQALSGLIAVALVTSASSMLLSGPRVYAKMANDGVLPIALGRLHGDHPRIAVLAQAFLSLIVVWSASLRDLLEFAGMTLSLSAGAVVIGWLRDELRATSSSPRFLKICASMFFLSATLGIAIATLVMRPASALAAAILICCGLVAHFFREFWRSPGVEGGGR